MIRSKGEAGTGDVSNATQHMRAISAEIRRLGSLSEDELFVAAKELQAPYELVVEVARAGKLPVTLFTAGGIATPADAAMMMQLGAEGVFVGSGIFKSGDPAQRAAAIVKATTFHDDSDVVAKVSRGLGEPMVGFNLDTLPAEQHYAVRDSPGRPGSWWTVTGPPEGSEMFERFTERARRVVVFAQEEARDLNHNYIGTEHLLLGLMRDADSVAVRALRELDIGQDAVREQVTEIIGRGKRPPSGHIPFTPRAKKVLELSLREALQLNHNYIGTEHILLGLVGEGEGVAAQVLV